MWSVYVSGRERHEQMLFRFNCPQSISQQHGVMAESTDSGACLRWNRECVCRLLIYFGVSVCEVGCYDERHEGGSSLKRGRHIMSAHKAVVTVICLLFVFYVVDSRQPNLRVWFGESRPDLQPHAPGLVGGPWASAVVPAQGHGSSALREQRAGQPRGASSSMIPRDCVSHVNPKPALLPPSSPPKRGPQVPFISPPTFRRCSSIRAARGGRPGGREAEREGLAAQRRQGSGLPAHWLLRRGWQ